MLYATAIKNLRGNPMPAGGFDLTTYVGRFAFGLYRVGYDVRDMTQQEVARLLGISQNTAFKWLRGQAKMDAENLVRWARLTGCREAWLVEGKAPMLSVYLVDEEHAELCQMIGELTKESRARVAEMVQHLRKIEGPRTTDTVDADFPAPHARSKH